MTEAGGKAFFTIRILSQPGAGTIVSIPLSIGGVDSDEASVSPLTVNFNNSNWSTPQLVTVTGVDDAFDDGDRAFTVVTGNAIAGIDDPNYEDRNPDVTGTNIDDDTVAVILSESSQVVVEGGATDSCR